jgi:hypothetical protein
VSDTDGAVTDAAITSALRAEFHRREPAFHAFAASSKVGVFAI